MTRRTAALGTLLPFLLLLSGACSSSSEDVEEEEDCPSDLDCEEPARDRPTQSSWVVGSWFSPMYESDSGYQPPMGFGIYSDGTWEHNTNGVVDASGKWTVSGSTIRLGGAPIEQYLPNCTAFRWENDAIPWAEYYRDDMPEGCPNTPDPLSPAERCLLGDFQVVHQTNVDTGTFKTKRTEHRTVVYEQYWSDTQTTVIGYWRWSGSQYCEIHTGEKQENCGYFDWNEVRSSRIGSPDPGCVYPDTGGGSGGSGGGGGPGGCDSGVYASIDSATCSNCVDCSLAGACADELAAFQSTPGAQAYLDCIEPCTTDACFTACESSYPAADSAYLNALSCAVCVECPNNCDATTNCE